MSDSWYIFLATKQLPATFRQHFGNTQAIWGVQNKKGLSGNLDFQNKKGLSGTWNFVFYLSLWIFNEISWKFVTWCNFEWENWGLYFLVEKCDESEKVRRLLKKCEIVQTSKNQSKEGVTCDKTHQPFIKCKFILFSHFPNAFCLLYWNNFV